MNKNLYEMQVDEVLEKFSAKESGDAEELPFPPATFLEQLPSGLIDDEC